MTFTQERYTNNVFKVNQSKLHHERKQLLNQINLNMRLGLINDEKIIRNSHIIGNTLPQSFKDQHQFNGIKANRLSSLSPDMNL